MSSMTSSVCLKKIHLSNSPSQDSIPLASWNGNFLERRSGHATSNTQVNAWNWPPQRQFFPVDPHLKYCSQSSSLSLRDRESDGTAIEDGIDPTRCTLTREKVACLSDNDARIALDPADNFLIQTKPHGHGDVHSVLFRSGILSKWEEAGVKWLLFFQDTNGLLFKAIPASLGVSALKDLDVNSLAVRRKAKEPIGGIARLIHENGSEMVINVEYNQLDPLLRAAGHADGDVNDESGFSPYPGNINQLVLKLAPYLKEITKTNGSIVEFVNPKYKDASKTSFKSSTRLEYMMQDYPRTLPPSAKVGFTVLDTWLAYAPVKNNPEDAAKDPPGNPRHSATSGEMAIYKANCLIFQQAGASIEGPRLQTFNGQEVELQAANCYLRGILLGMSSRRRSIFMLATAMLVFAGQAYNIPQIIAPAKAPLTDVVESIFGNLILSSKHSGIGVEFDLMLAIGDLGFRRG